MAACGRRSLCRAHSRRGVALLVEDRLLSRSRGRGEVAGWFDPRWWLRPGSVDLVVVAVDQRDPGRAWWGRGGRSSKSATGGARGDAGGHHLFRAGAWAVWGRFLGICAAGEDVGGCARPGRRRRRRRPRPGVCVAFLALGQPRGQLRGGRGFGVAGRNASGRMTMPLPSADRTSLPDRRRLRALGVEVVDVDRGPPASASAWLPSRTPVARSIASAVRRGARAASRAPVAATCEASREVSARRRDTGWRGAATVGQPGTSPRRTRGSARVPARRPRATCRRRHPAGVARAAPQLQVILLSWRNSSRPASAGGSQLGMLQADGLGAVEEASVVSNSARLAAKRRPPRRPPSRSPPPAGRQPPESAARPPRRRGQPLGRP